MGQRVVNDVLKNIKELCNNLDELRGKNHKTGLAIKQTAFQM